MNPLPANPSKRECGACTACCKTHAVVEIRKPPNEWCPHCAIGIGCKIYVERPQTCCEFQCAWLTDLRMPDELRPDKTRVVLSMPEEKVIIANVDPGRPEATRKGLIGQVLDRAVDNGLLVVEVIGPRKHFRCKSAEQIADFMGRVQEWESVNAVRFEAMDRERQSSDR
jgi:uncharacterized protein